MLPWVRNRTPGSRTWTYRTPLGSSPAPTRITPTPLSRRREVQPLLRCCDWGPLVGMRTSSMPWCEGVQWGWGRAWIGKNGLDFGRVG